MVKVTVSEYAKKRGIHERSVRRYLAEGLIPAAAQIREGRFLFIDQGKADKALSTHATTRKELLGDVSLPPAGKAVPAQMVQTTEKAGTAGLSFHDARTLTQRYKAALMKIELDEKTGRLVDSEQVKVAAFNSARAVRDSLLNITDRISPILAAEKDQNRVAEILTAEIKTALEGLSQ
jgi:hypothetical protein